MSVLTSRRAMKSLVDLERGAFAAISSSLTSPIRKSRIGARWWIRLGREEAAYGDRAVSCIGSTEGYVFH